VLKGMGRMNEDQRKTLKHIKTITMIGLIIGFIVFLVNFFVSGLTKEYYLFIGLSIIVSSMTVLGFGVILALMEERGNGNNSQKLSKPRLYLVKKSG
jgi:magnesium-transporting ATPase (P-type)